MVALDRRVVAALSALPFLEPAPGFEDRVMAGVTRMRPIGEAAVQWTPRELAARRRVIGTTLVAGGAVAAGFAWAAGHPTDALGWAGPAIQEAGNGLWPSIQSWAVHASEQPWFGTLRDALAAPARTLPMLGLAALAYAAVLTGLRRVMTEPAAHASW
jgi:hypothetical protein